MLQSLLQNPSLILGLVLTILIAGAHLVQILVPHTSVAYKIADKILALGPNLFQLFGAHPNPPPAYDNAPAKPLIT